MGEQPVAWAPKKRTSLCSTRPSATSSRKALRIFADKRTAGHGDDDVVGEAPAELLGDLVADGLGAFGVVGPEVDVDEAPLVLVGDEGAEAVDVVVVTVDADQAGAVDESVEDLGGLEVGGDEDAGLEAEPGSLGGYGVGEIAGGGAADRGEAEGLGIGESDGNDAVFEAECGEADGVVLDVEIASADALAEVLGADQRREAYGEIRLEAFRDGQQLFVAPDVGGAGGDGLAGKAAADAFQVVLDFKGGQAVLAG